jgi:DNA-binding CsgD family transcriptional regulator
LADSDVSELLTARELEVLLLIARGLPNKEIGAGLGVSEPTLRKIIGRLRARPRKGPPGGPPPSAGAVVT